MSECGSEEPAAGLQDKWELKERVKELTCLYQLSRLTEVADSVEQLLFESVALLPRALQFPEKGVARIRYETRVFESGSWQDCRQVLQRPMNGLTSGPGLVEVGYVEECLFLPEEAQLLEMVAEHLVQVIERLKTLEDLKASEQRFRLLADNTLDVIWSLDPNLKVTYVNEAVTALTGYTPEEYIGTDAREHFSAAELQAIEETIQGALSAGPSHPGVIREFNLLNRDGQEVPVEIHARVLYDEQGRPVGYHGTSRDIRERRLTLEALRRSEEQYRTLFETMAQGAVFQGPDGKITSANPAAQRILGLSLEEMVSRTSDHPEWRAIREDGSEYPGLEHPAMRALSTAEPVQNSIMGIFNPRDGDYRWLKVSAAPQFRPGEETPYQVFSTFEDLTELRRAEDQRRAANLFSTELLESIRDGFLALDHEMRLTYLNGAAETLLGKDRKDLVGQNLLEAFPAAHCPVFEQKFRQALSERVRLDFESYCESQQAWHEVQVYPSATGISVFFRNISERKRGEQERQEIEAQLRQAQKMEAVGRLAGGLAHDFNNMLSVILGHTEFAISSLDPGDPLQEDLSEIAGAAQRSASLTRQLLAFARKQTISPKVLDLNQAIAQLLKMLRRLVGEDLKLLWNPEPELAAVKMDPSQLDQVLTNLVVNARDAIEGVGSITIETQGVRVDESFCRQHLGLHPGDYVKLTVSDTGSGIDPEFLPNLFEPFFTTKPEGRGTGLGLAIVHGIVQQNGGVVEVSSELGKGSTFVIFLPAVIALEASGPTADAVVSVRGRETVLLVEDEPSLLRLTARMLASLGYQVVSARSPKEAIRICSRDQVDLLLTDVVMPEMNGAELSRRLRAMHPGLKCLFMSGYTSDALGERGGVLDDEVYFMQKPFSKEELARKTREALDQRSGRPDL